MQEPKIPTHILFDRRAIDSGLIVKIVPLVFTEPELKSTVELSIVGMGGQERIDRSGKSFPEGTYQVDLRSALQRLLADYRALDKKGVATRNPEVLILLGTLPLDDWLGYGRSLGSYFPLIVSYWLDEGNLSNTSRTSIESLLLRISPDDPQTGAPRHQIREVKAQALQDALQDILTKLKNRLLQKVHAKPGFVTKLDTGRL